MTDQGGCAEKQKEQRERKLDEAREGVERPEGPIYVSLTPRYEEGEPHHGSIVLVLNAFSGDPLAESRASRGSEGGDVGCSSHCKGTSSAAVRAPGNGTAAVCVIVYWVQAHST